MKNVEAIANSTRHAAFAVPRTPPAEDQEALHALVHGETCIETVRETPMLPIPGNGTSGVNVPVVVTLT